MAEAKSKSGGSKLTRTQTVTVRLDPKLRYLAELAARKQRRTVSSYIEWAIEQSLEGVSVIESDDYNRRTMFAEVAEHLWDVEEADRFAVLAISYPELLTHDEQLIWKIVRESPYLWRGSFESGEWRWDLEGKDFHAERLREHWDTYKKVAAGELSAEALPKWSKDESFIKPRPSAKAFAAPIKSPATTFDDFDDDIPF